MDKDSKGTSFEELQSWLDKGRPNNFLSKQSTYEKINTSSNYFPGLNESFEVLGSRQDINGVILHTGQIQYEEFLIEFNSSENLDFNLIYTSRENFQSGFGKHWNLSAISSFDKVDDNKYMLFLSNGEKYSFSYDCKKDIFTDDANLGITVEKHDENNFTLINRFGKKDSIGLEKLFKTKLKMVVR